MADYIVQAGDTLAKIAKAHGTTVEELAKLNGIKDANKIAVGQELIFEAPGAAAGNEPAKSGGFFEDAGNSIFGAPKAPQAAASGGKKPMSNEELQAKLEQQEKEIKRLQNMTLGEKAVEDIERGAKKVGQWIDEAAETVSETAKETYHAVEKGAKAVGEFVEETAETVTEAVTETAKETYHAVEKGAEAVGEFVEETAEDVKEFHNKNVDRAENAARNAANTGKNWAWNARAKMKVNVPEKVSNEKDTSKMTPEERLAYQEEQIQQLKSESLGGRFVRELGEGLDNLARSAAKTYNKAVDATYNGARRVYHGMADGAKAVLDWLKF